MSGGVRMSLQKLLTRFRTFTEADARRVRTIACESNGPWLFIVGALMALTAAAVGSPFAMGKGILPATLLCAGLICAGYIYAKSRIKHAISSGQPYDAARFGFAFDMAPLIVVFAMFIPRLAIQGSWQVLLMVSALFTAIMMVAFFVGPWRKVAKLTADQLRDIIRDPTAARRIDFRR